MGGAGYSVIGMSSWLSSITQWRLTSYLDKLQFSCSIKTWVYLLVTLNRILDVESKRVVVM